MNPLQPTSLALFTPYLQSEQPVQQLAWLMLQEIGLPSTKSELYKYTDIVKNIKSTNFSKTETSVHLPPQIFESEGYHVVTVNGRIDFRHSKLEGLSIKELPISEGRHDPFSLINTSLASTEIKITDADMPIFIYHLTSDSISNPRIKVSVSKHAVVHIVEQFIGEPNTFTNAYIEFDIQPNAKATYSKIQDYGNQINHETVSARMANDSRFYTNIFSFAGRLVRNNIFIDLEGQNCEGYMSGLFLLNGHSHVDNNTSVDHIQPNSYSHELYKGILDDKSTGIFNGKIYVRQEAQKTNAFQSNNNILLSNDATLHTKPQLEIWADDVKCSHGCTSGQLDEDAIFYLRARGIDQRSAKKMLLKAFAEDPLSRVPIEEITKIVLEKVEQKLS